MGPDSGQRSSRTPPARRRAEVLREIHQEDANVEPNARGIFLPDQKELNFSFTSSKVTSDFIVDRLDQWWQANQQRHPKVRRLLLDLDNGPENHSRRSQFIDRLVLGAQATQLTIELVCYPPYHSKYNPIEHCWGVLEVYWNGELLLSEEAVLGFAGNRTYAGKHPSVYRVSQTYCKRRAAEPGRDEDPGRTSGAFGPRAEVVRDHCTGPPGRDHSPVRIGSPRHSSWLATPLDTCSEDELFSRDRLSVRLSIALATALPTTPTAADWVLRPGVRPLSRRGTPLSEARPLCHCDQHGEPGNESRGPVSWSGEASPIGAGWTRAGSSPNSIKRHKLLPGKGLHSSGAASWEIGWSPDK